MYYILNALGLSQGEQQTLMICPTLLCQGQARLRQPITNVRKPTLVISILSDSFFEQSKRSNLVTFSPLLSDDATPLKSDQAMVKAVESSLERVYDRFDLLLSKLSSLEDIVADLKLTSSSLLISFFG